MSRNRQFQRLIHCMFLKTNVASFRSDDNPSISLKGSDDLLVGETRHFAHTDSSINSAPDEKVGSSSTGSRYNSIASRIFRIASSRDSPSEIQPGSDGTVIVYPPSSLGSKMTLSFMLSSENQFLFGVGFKFMQGKGLTDRGYYLQCNYRSA